MHLTSSPVDWYAARAAGIAAYVVLTAVIAFGLALSSRSPGRRWRRWPAFAVEDVHRFGGLLVGSFIGLHVVTIAIDSFTPFSFTQLAVPFGSGYRPLWTGLGIAAAELLAALAIANHYRRLMPYRWWRATHYANFAVWIAATLHGVGAGSDRHAPWMLAVYAGSTALVGGLLLWRIAARRQLPGLLTPGRVVTAALAGPAVVAVLALVPIGGGSGHHARWAFTDTLTGRIHQQTGTGASVVTMSGVGRGDQDVLVRADLLVDTSSLRATTFQLEFLRNGETCTGTVSNVHADGFTGSCGSHTVRAQWKLVDGSRLAGTLRSVSDDGENT